jgi:hypothetical protein
LMRVRLPKTMASAEVQRSTEKIGRQRTKWEDDDHDANHILPAAKHAFLLSAFCFLLFAFYEGPLASSIFARFFCLWFWVNAQPEEALGRSLLVISANHTRVPSTRLAINMELLASNDSFSEIFASSVVRNRALDWCLPRID